MAKDVKYGILLELRDKVTKGLGKVQKGFKDFAKNVEGASRTARRGLLGVAAGIGAVVYASAQQEEAETKLRAALEATGQYSDDVYRRLHDLAGEIQNVTVHGDELILGLQAQALNLGVTEDKMGEATRGAVGLATALEMDLNTALRYTALAMQGEYTVLQRYVPELRTAKEPAEKLAIVQRIMAQGFEQAAARAETLEGRVLQLKNRFGDLLQAIGETIFGTDNWADTVNALQETIKGAIDWIENITDEQKQNILTLVKWGVGILAVIAVLGPLANAIAGVCAAIKFMLAPAGLISALFLIIAGAALTVTDALGLTETGIYDLLSSWEPLDSLWTQIAAGMARAADLFEAAWYRMVSTARWAVAEVLEIREKLVGWIPGVDSLESLVGVDPEQWIKDLRKMNEDAKALREQNKAASEEVVASLWAGYEKRNPPAGKAPDAAAAKDAAGKAADSTKGVNEQAQILNETIIPVLEALANDQDLTKEELKDLNRRLKRLAQARK